MKDSRKEPRLNRVCIFSPVGDVQQFKEFQARMINLKISEDPDVDFLFVVLKSISQDIINECKLSAQVYSEDKVKLGTSGAFFAGQVTAYQMGYKYIVVADLDAEINSKKLFDKLLQICRKEKRIVVPLSKAKTSEGEAKLYNMNQWSFIPRKIFEKYGFATGYFYKGSEDYDQMCRMKKDITIFKKGVIFHPMTGFTVYHKFVDKKKMYPYLASLCKDYLLLKKYPEYCLWFSYFCFFADTFGDDQLKFMMKDTIHMEKLHQDIINDNPYVKITSVKEIGTPSSSKAQMLISIFKSLGNFMMGKPFYIYTDKVELTMGKMALFFGLCKAVTFIPLRIFESLCNVVEWHDLYREKIRYPIYIKDIDYAEKWMLSHFPKD